MLPGLTFFFVYFFLVSLEEATTTSLKTLWRDGSSPVQGLELGEKTTVQQLTQAKLLFFPY